MRLIVFALALLTALASAPASAQQSVISIPYTATPLGQGQLSSFSGVTSLNSIVVNGVTGIPATARCANFAFETNSVRWRDDGTAPSASVGMLQAVGQSLIACEPIANLNNFQFVPTSGSATVDVTFYK